jgi:hypothetical protein
MTALISGLPGLKSETWGTQHFFTNKLKAKS